ncbi:unnamed protein product [Cylicocyclus nassatus]|uniref:Serpentine receptor class gamma n=1 Tax=Cylicocyclus nassatus TaxID=53992 RepID=A0AA36GK98_CYLNA|nr:unnamed protein product [Cylicocyclus nassatus]
MFQVFLIIAMVMIPAIIAISFLLCCIVLVIMWRDRRSSRYKSFFYKCWWSEGLMNLFTFVYFISTIYARFYNSASDAFMYLNHFPWWTKFAELSQEQIMYIQIMNVFLTVAGRICTVCLPHSAVTSIIERLNKWEIFGLQITIPTITVIPLFFIFDFEYGLTQPYEIPKTLGSTSPHYSKVLFLLGLTYRGSAFAICVFGYVFLFWTVRSKAKRKETNILVLCGCLLGALGVEVAYTVLFYFREKGAYEAYAVVRLLCFTSMLWIPFTDIVVTILVLAPLRKSIIRLVTNQPETATTTVFQASKCPSTVVASNNQFTVRIN